MKEFHDHEVVQQLLERACMRDEHNNAGCKEQLSTMSLVTLTPALTATLFGNYHILWNQNSGTARQRLLC